MNNVLVRFVSACVLAVTWILVWQQILYASELPGEGFSASILALLAILLQFVVLGHAVAARRLPTVTFKVAVVAGFVLLLGLLAVPLAWGAPMFTVFKLPLGFTVLSSTTLFDVALFLMVGGGMLMAFTGVLEASR
jgi:hypothetical protein